MLCILACNLASLLGVVPASGACFPEAVRPKADRPKAVRLAAATTEALQVLSCSCFVGAAVRLAYVPCSATADLNDLMRVLLLISYFSIFLPF